MKRGIVFKALSFFVNCVWTLLLTILIMLITLVMALVEMGQEAAKYPGLVKNTWKTYYGK